MKKKKKVQPYSDKYAVYYIGKRHNNNGFSIIHRAPTLRQPIKMILSSIEKAQRNSRADLSLQKVKNLEVKAYFNDGREFLVPHTLYSQGDEHDLLWLPTAQIPEHFSTDTYLHMTSDVQLIPSEVASDVAHQSGSGRDLEEYQQAKVELQNDSEYLVELEPTEQYLLDLIEVELVEQSLPELAKSNSLREELSESSKSEPIPEPEVENIIDARARVAASVVRRRGQPEFCKALIQAYNSECAVTGCNAVEALEAAHISPYRGPNTNHPSNGLLLRADLHTLFDLGLIAIDAQTMTVVLAESLTNTTYAEINGRALRPPKNESFRPNVRALDKHKSESKVS